MFTHTHGWPGATFMMLFTSQVSQSPLSLTVSLDDSSEILSWKQKSLPHQVIYVSRCLTRTHPQLCLTFCTTQMSVIETLKAEQN